MQFDFWMHDSVPACTQVNVQMTVKPSVKDLDSGTLAHTTAADWIKLTKKKGCPADNDVN